MFKAAPFFQDLIRYPSLIGTIVVNVAPLAGVLFWGWGVGPLVVLYWLENVVVGGITLLRMITSGLAWGIAALGLLFIVPFFVVHYGLFCFVHGIFVMAFIAGGQQTSKLVDSPVDLFQTALHAAPHMPWMLGLIAAWRLILFLTQFVLRGEFAKTNPMDEMGRPYGRIITLHFAIFAGAFSMMALGQPSWGMFALIGLKTVFDFVSVRKDARGLQTNERRAEETAKARAAYQDLQNRIKARFATADKKPPAA